MAKKRRTHTIKTAFMVSAFTPIIIFSLLVAIGIVLSIIYASTGNKGILVALIAYAVVCIPVLVVISFLSVRYFIRVYRNGLVKTSLDNMEKLSNGNGSLEHYPGEEIEEIKQINQYVDSTKNMLTNATLIAGKNYEPDFDLKIGENGLIDMKSFKQNFNNIIFASQNYRNLLACLYYELGDDEINDVDMQYILGVLKKAFKDYKGLLFISGGDGKSIYIYMPRIDSTSKLKEHFEYIIRNVTISDRRPEGLVHIPGKIAVVCYPYSELHNIFSDLGYAMRQNKSINFYLPDRLPTIPLGNISINSINLNYLSKLLMKLSNLEPKGEKVEENEKLITSTLKSIQANLKIDHVGLVLRSADTNQFLSVAYFGGGKNIFALGNPIDNRLLDALDKAVEEDGSYYFSTRSHASSEVGHMCDILGINAGLFHLIKNDGHLIGFIYFINDVSDMVIDSYIQESLCILSSRIEQYFINMARQSNIREEHKAVEAVMMASNYYTYKINRIDHRLLSASSKIKDVFPNFALGEKCHKVLYGLEKPCEHCPLIEGNKMITHRNNKSYSTSLLLNDQRSKEYRLFVKEIENIDHEYDRYNKDLLINSLPSLVEALRNYFSFGDRGNLLLLKIDNLEDIVKEKGSEWVLLFLRNFVSRIKLAGVREENIFFYNSHTLAILYPRSGQNDILDKCERIYALSKQTDIAETQGYSLNITYLSCAYPGVYSSAEDFLRATDRFYFGKSYQSGKDFIYFSDSDYSRSASRAEFILSVINQQFVDQTFSAKLQPIMSSNGRHIQSAELLLRIADSYRNITLNADEVVRVAAKNDKIGLISHALLDYIGNLYEQYGSNLFKQYGFKRLTLNTDYSYFGDPSFYKELSALMKKFKMPSSFVGFEIGEDDISNHINEYAALSKQLASIGVPLICDRYVGKYLSFQALKKLGFNEVKLDRKLVMHIDSDSNDLISLRMLIETARESKMKVTFVGVQNLDQYNLVRDMDIMSTIQGYYFYQPLEKAALVEAIRSQNALSKTSNKEEEK